MANCVTAKELAVILGFHYRTVVAKARQGLIPFMRAGKKGRKRFDPDEVKRKLSGA
jgi:excisionase family DNA binding protein